MKEREKYWKLFDNKYMFGDEWLHLIALHIQWHKKVVQFDGGKRKILELFDNKYMFGDEWLHLIALHIRWHKSRSIWWRKEKNIGKLFDNEHMFGDEWLHLIAFLTMFTSENIIINYMTRSKLF
jgi:hypothetical protein